MRIQQLKLTNFRGFVDATLDLDRPLTVLYGPNGSGKSSVLEAIAAAISELCSHALMSDDLWSVHVVDEDIRVDTRETLIEANVINGEVSGACSLRRKRGESRELTGRVARYMRVFGAAPFLAVSYGASRSVAQASEAFSKEAAQNANTIVPAPPALRDAMSVGQLKFRSLFSWFKEREDAENELKVSRADLTLEDPLLGAVRRAVAGMLPGFTGLRVQRDPLHMVIRKGDTLLAIDQLSDGEKLLVALAADLARRLAMTFTDTDPLLGEALVLIDEVELHLHPAWQRRVLGRLRETFPHCQFVVTTHSPQVLSEVPNDAVVLVKDFAFLRPGAATSGRDSNAILSEAMDTAERPEAKQLVLREISALIDAGRYRDARSKLDELARAVTDRDREVVGFRTMLHFLEGDDAADSQGA